MQINTNDPGLLTALNARLTKEIGETFAANCALDLIADAQAAEIDRLRKTLADTVEANSNNIRLVDELRAQNEELRQTPRSAYREIASEKV